MSIFVILPNFVGQTQSIYFELLHLWHLLYSNNICNMFNPEF